MQLKRKSNSDWIKNDNFTMPSKKSRRSLSLDDLNKMHYNSNPKYHGTNALDKCNYIESSLSNTKSTSCAHDRLMYDETFECNTDSSNSFRKDLSYSSITLSYTKTPDGTEDISMYPTPLCDCSDCMLQAMKTFCGEDVSPDDSP